jgi:hypothetical protein
MWETNHIDLRPKVRWSNKGPTEWYIYQLRFKVNHKYLIDINVYTDVGD